MSVSQQKVWTHNKQAKTKGDHRRQKTYCRANFRTCQDFFIAIPPLSVVFSNTTTFIYENEYMKDHIFELRRRISFIFSFASFTVYGYITNSQNDQLPHGLIA